MKEYTNQAGVTFRVGDAITAYHKGIFLLVKIQNRTGYSPLFCYKRIATKDGVPSTLKSISVAVEYECDSEYCSLVTEESLRKQLSQIQKNYEATIELLRKISENNS